MAVLINLTWPQMAMAGNVGVMRRTSNCVKGRKQSHGKPDGAGSWEDDIFACQAEVAVAAYLNLFWCGTVGNIGAVDVGGLVEVRATGRPDGRLILHKEDDDLLPFVTVYADPPRFTLNGWCFAGEGKLEEFWSDPARNNRPAYFVDRRVLRPMPTLIEWVEGHRHEAEARVA